MKKKLLIVCILLTGSLVSFAQDFDILNHVEANLLEIKASIMQVQQKVDLMEEQKAQQPSSTNYVLYPTPNVWNYLRLNVHTGQIDHVQYALDDEHRFIEVVNPENFSNGENSSFELHQTPNTAIFLLFDKSDGRVWQVIWHINKEKRSIIPIQ